MEKGSSSQDVSAEKEPRYSIPQTSQYQTSNFEDAPNFSQSRQTQLSGGPLQGKMLSQFYGGNIDLSAAYGHLHSFDQQIYQTSQPFNTAMMTGEEAHCNEMMNRYDILLSNIHPQFQFSRSSSTNGGAQIGSLQTLVPFESSGIEAMVPFESSGTDTMVNTDMHNAYSVPRAQNLDSARPMRSQGFSYPLSTPNGFGISNNWTNPATSAHKALYESSMSGLLNDIAAQHSYPAQQMQNNAATVVSPIPIRPVSTTRRSPYQMNTPTGFNPSANALSSSSSLKRKVPSQDETPPNYQSRNSNFGRGLHRYSSSYNNGERYSLYDKRYEDVGLPLDPHLRIFIASNGTHTD